ncbi:PPE domain-containing protein [Mycobacterium conspicuum]|uniref:PPE domain-containing protein n=1 Tax=Mycobacterium conspicuum TaxID=44010 RepID=UPI00355796AD
MVCHWWAGRRTTRQPAGSYQSVVSGLTTGHWLGPRSVSVPSAVAPYVSCTAGPARRPDEASAQASAAPPAHAAPDRRRGRPVADVAAQPAGWAVGNRPGTVRAPGPATGPSPTVVAQAPSAGHGPTMRPISFVLQVWLLSELVGASSCSRRHRAGPRRYEWGADYCPLAGICWPRGMSSVAIG